MHSNTIYNKEGQVAVSCAALAPPWSVNVMSLEVFQSQGYEKGTTISVIPPDDEIIQLAKNILRM